MHFFIYIFLAEHFHISYDVYLQMEYRNAQFDQIIYQDHIWCRSWDGNV